MPTLHEIVIGLNATLVVASLALATQFYRVWRDVLLRDWLGMVRALFTAPKTVISQFGRCTVTADEAPRRLAGAVFIISSAMGGICVRVVLILVLSAWSVGANPYMATFSAVLTLWAILGYYIALVAWRASEDGVDARGVMVRWALILSAVGISAPFIAHAIRSYFLH